MAEIETMNEEQLVEAAAAAVSDCQWTVGRIASQWTKRFSKGRGDQAFGERLGISGDSIYQRRRVWETFADVREQYPRLKWSHFLIALTWDDAAECLGWAEEMEATVSEMRAWRRAQHGEDLSEESDKEQGVIGEEDQLAEMTSEALSSAKDRQASGAVTLDEFDGEQIERERSQARDQAPEAFTYEAIARRLCATLEKCERAFSPEIVEEWESLPESLRERLAGVIDQLAAKLSMVEG